MWTYILSSCRAIMPQINIGGDVTINFNGDGWLAAVLFLVALIALARRL